MYEQKKLVDKDDMYALIDALIDALILGDAWLFWWQVAI